MYKQSDKSAAIRAIQEYLFLLSSDKHKSIPRIPIDGIFDKETSLAVKEFQKIKGIAPTGTVDFITFTELYNDYKSEIDNADTNDYILGSGTLPLKEGDQNEDVRALHLMINELRKTYPQITDAGTSTYFSSRTTKAIKNLRDLFLMPGSMQFDKELFRRTKTELNARKLAKEKYN